MSHAETGDPGASDEAATVGASPAVKLTLTTLTTTVVGSMAGAVVLIVTMFSDDAFNFALDPTSALSHTPFLLAAGFAVKIAIGSGRQGQDVAVAGKSTRGELSSSWSPSSVLNAPATLLFVKARREQDRRLFSPREAVTCWVSIACCHRPTKGAP
ncbi:hypothetical protein ACFVXC_03055 [Streptomyces sp. NPDC058257]|uniref:hypothetical protein n=1 Tax=Streptomyces sp. NPDC058257 TaxID=3346409 RepID=UPI0036F1107B